MQTIVLHFCYFVLILLFSTAYNTSLIYFNILFRTIVLHSCYFVLILLFSTAYNTSLIYCFVRWRLHTNKRRSCSSTLLGHPSSSLLFLAHMQPKLPFPEALPVRAGKRWGCHVPQVCKLVSALSSATLH